MVYVLAGPAGAPAGATDALGTLIYRNAFGSTGAFAGMSLRMSYAIPLCYHVCVPGDIFRGAALIATPERGTDMSEAAHHHSQAVIKRDAVRLARHVILIVACIIVICPIAYMFIASLNHSGFL